MKLWLILPIFLVALSMIVKFADCYESTKDIIFHEELLRNKTDDVQNDMVQLNTNLPTFKNITDSEKESLPNQRISLSFSRYIFNKTRNGIMGTVKAVDESKNILMSKIVTIKDDFLKKLDETFKNVKDDMQEAVESVTETSASVVICVLDQKSAFDSLLGESITKTIDCVNDILQESAKAIDEAVNLTTEAKALVEDLSKQESKCDSESAEDSGILKCLLEVLRLTKTSVNLILVKIKDAVKHAFKSSNGVLLKMNSCQSTESIDQMNTDAAIIIQNLKKCSENSDTLLRKTFYPDMISEDLTVNYSEDYVPPDLEDYGEDDYLF